MALLTLREVLERYETLTTDLQDYYRSEAKYENARIKTYYDTMTNSEADSVSGRTRDAEAAAADYERHLTMIRCDIKCLQAELRHLDNVINAYRSGVL